MSRRRKEDRELWEQVKKSVKPLHSDRASAKFKQAVGEMHKPRPAPVRGPSRIVKPHVPEPAIRISLAPKPDRLDASTARKIAKGRLAIDGRIDLHGMTQAEAHARLFRYLSTAHTLGNRTILVITGKGVRGEGILRQAVPRWLAEPEFRAIASGFSEAHVSHGGSGALYVRVRNPRAGER
ncbi:MAG: Smr/MutS family protein [Rhizobiaceae bacterium]|jgi:DNA-nicking Smr family endonuclease|nr:Smr/MutS family protein [Rhizobiaceae bacterium]